MKKTMFITSVIMVVVMAIALTTSSLAWFSANGSPTVTTDALTLTAMAEASTGIQISAVSATEGWGLEASLNGLASTSGSGKVDSNSVTGADDETNGMLPVLPLSGLTTWATEAADKKAAMLNGLGSVAGNAAFQGNYISTVDFDGTPYANGYFVDEIWITNTASGDGAAAVAITPSCAFYEAGTDTAYTSSSTGYSTDPVLYVAVLAANGTAAVASTCEYEVVNIFNSKGLTTLNIGKTATEFANGATVASSYFANISISDVRKSNGTTTFTLPAAVDGAAFGEARIFKIVAWYDATTLNNNNSGFEVDFALTFNVAS